VSDRAAESAAWPRPAYAWTVVLILVATAILSYTDRQVLSLLVDPLRADLHIGDTQISLLLGLAFALVYGVAGVPVGWLADRTSRRNLIAAGVLVWSVGTLCCSASRNFGEIFASRLLVGLGEAALSPAAIALISDYFPPQRRGAAVGLFLSGIAIGVGASIFIGGGVLEAVEVGLFAATPLAHLAPWRLVLLLLGVPGLLWSGVIFAIREPQRRHDEVPVTGETAPEAASASRRWIRAAPVYVVLAVASLVDNAVGAWAPSLLIRQFSMDPAKVGIELGVLLTIGYGGGVLIGGALADVAGARGGAALKLVVALLCSLLILPVAALVPLHDLTAVFVGVPVYFALSGAVTAVGFAVLLDVVPSRARGLAMSMSFFLNVAVGAGLGPTVVAVLAARAFAGGALGPALSVTIAGGYLFAASAAFAAWRMTRAHEALARWSGRPDSRARRSPGGSRP
jgi:MFS family permease